MLLFLLSRSELRELLAGLGYQVSEATGPDGRLLPGADLPRLDLSVVSAWLLARYEPERAWRFLQQALESDVADVQGGTAAEDIHLGAMAGTVDTVLRCLAGLRARGEVLWFDPALPPQVKQVKFSIHYRHHRIDVALAEDRFQISSRPGEAAEIQVHVRDETIQLVPAPPRISPGAAPMTVPDAS